MKKTWLIISLIVVCIVAAIILFSPYGNSNRFAYKAITHTVEINAPVEKVFNFLGRSANASRWSVFVNHITPLNADSVQDGMHGSTRRCFCRVDETGMQWDELITEVIPNQKRQLTIYNLKGFPMTAEDLATEQLYESTGENKCRLTFTVFIKRDAPSLVEKFKMYIAAYKIESIFKQNMKNIKSVVEKERNG
jgi:uncharacterized protein YndB with AHSA1/START domain